MIWHEKEFVCRRCGERFRLRAPYVYYCPPCGRKRKSESIMQRRAAKDHRVALGVGSGGNQWGRKNHCFKDGLSNYKRNFDRTHPHQRCCEICAGTQNLVVHHVDWNRKNNRLDNLMMLCRSCHAQVHGVAANLGEVPLVQKNDVPIVAEAACGPDFGHMAEME